jgi:hypothetical protein
MARAPAKDPLDEADLFAQMLHGALAGTFDPAPFSLGGCDARYE